MFLTNRTRMCILRSIVVGGFFPHRKLLKFCFAELELTDINALAERAPSAGETMIPLDILGEGKNLAHI